MVLLKVRWLVNYLVRKVLVFDAGLILIAGLTFLFTGNFSMTAYSERILWAGVIVFLIAGTVAMAQMVPGRMLFFPYNIRQLEDAKNFVKQTTEFREQADKRIDLGIQLFLIGLGCLGASALVQTFLA
jgi:hypothetical protein